MTQYDDSVSSKELKEAVDQESSHFEELYLWLKKSMPSIFFREVPEEWVISIVHSLMSFRLQDYFSQIHLKNAAITLCIDNSGADLKILKGYPDHGIKNYTTYISRLRVPFHEIEGKLRIATIQFTEAFETKIFDLPQDQVDAIMKELQKNDSSRTEADCMELMHSVGGSFLRKMQLDKQVFSIEMFERARTRDHCQHEVLYDEKWEETSSPSMQLILAWKNVPKHNFLYRLARVIYQHDLIMRRVNATYVDPYKTSSIFILSIGIHGKEGKAAWESADIQDLLQEIVTLKYFGGIDKVDETFVTPRLATGNMGNFIRTMITFIHQVLVQEDPHLYSFPNIYEGICRHPELTVKLCEAFNAKCHPTEHNFEKFESIREEFLSLLSQLDTGHEANDRRRRAVLLQGMNFIDHILKTNFFRKNKTAFAFRLDPQYLKYAPYDYSQYFPKIPYGIFFIKGMHFFGFHIRFKDLSRGGLRTVFPHKEERMLIERDRVFSECYHLAYTQDKKNKDIPEGGAKAVIFLKPNQRLEKEVNIHVHEMKLAGIPEEDIERTIKTFIDEQKLEYLYQTQRSFIKTFLSIINCDEDGTLRAPDIVDYYKKPEYIYLGPDENMHNLMIEWIAKESQDENYRPGSAFISGKPSLGINHKAYGVTSMGVNVYMHELLLYFGINPEKEPFSVKMTGGPDGDVAGNQLLNLYRHYPKTAKLIALTDISGTIHDPKGLDLEAMVDLFHRGESINKYPPEKLSIGGFLLDLTQKKEPSQYVQQTLCWKNKDGNSVAHWLSGNEMNSLFRNNVHKTVADIFIPCGGRPRTLGDHNWEDFLDEEGHPTAKGIVEGANLYFSTHARESLQEKGVVIIKDSSANKGGVICSSFEILCGLTLDDDIFLRRKEKLVKEILARLRYCARQEAHLLLQSREELKKPLTHLSDEISEKINGFTDQLLEHLEPFSQIELKEILNKCFLSYCIPTLRRDYEKELLANVPLNHKKAVIAAHMAARLVYTRGLEWQPTLTDILPVVLKDPYLFEIQAGDN
jgi:glutamate dehydrogenase